jgi:hypothetical protein
LTTDIWLTNYLTNSQSISFTLRHPQRKLQNIRGRCLFSFSTNKLLDHSRWYDRHRQVSRRVPAAVVFCESMKHNKFSDIMNQTPVKYSQLRKYTVVLWPHEKDS